MKTTSFRSSWLSQVTAAIFLISSVSGPLSPAWAVDSTQAQPTEATATTNETGALIPAKPANSPPAPLVFPPSIASLLQHEDEPLPLTTSSRTVPAETDPAVTPAVPTNDVYQVAARDEDDQAAVQAPHTPPDIEAILATTANVQQGTGLTGTGSADVVTASSQVDAALRPRERQSDETSDEIMENFYKNIAIIHWFVEDINRRYAAGTASETQVVFDLTEQVLKRILDMIKNDKFSIPGYFEALRVEFRNAAAIARTAIRNAAEKNMLLHQQTLLAFLSLMAEIARKLNGREDEAPLPLLAAPSPAPPADQRNTGTPSASAGSASIAGTVLTGTGSAVVAAGTSASTMQAGTAGLGAALGMLATVFATGNANQAPTEAPSSRPPLSTLPNPFSALFGPYAQYRTITHYRIENLPEGGKRVIFFAEGEASAQNPTPVLVAEIAPGATSGTFYKLTPSGNPEPVSDGVQIHISGDNLSLYTSVNRINGVYYLTLWYPEYPEDGSVGNQRIIARLLLGEEEDGTPSPATLYSVLFEKPDQPAIEVAQHTVAFGRFGRTNLDRNFIQTPGCATCVAFAVYDPETHVGTVAHIDALTDLEESLKLIRNRLTSLGVDLSRARVALATSEGDNLLMQIQNMLMRDRVLEKGWGIQAGQIRLYRSDALMLSLEDGSISTFNQSVQSMPEEHLRHFVNGLVEGLIRDGAARLGGGREFYFPLVIYDPDSHELPRFSFPTSPPSTSRVNSTSTGSGASASAAGGEGTVALFAADAVIAHANQEGVSAGATASNAPDVTSATSDVVLPPLGLAGIGSALVLGHTPSPALQAEPVIFQPLSFIADFNSYTGALRDLVVSHYDLARHLLLRVTNYLDKFRSKGHNYFVDQVLMALGDLAGVGQAGPREDFMKSLSFEISYPGKNSVFVSKDGSFVYRCPEYNTSCNDRLKNTFTVHVYFPGYPSQGGSKKVAVFNLEITQLLPASRPQLQAGGNQPVPGDPLPPQPVGQNNGGSGNLFPQPPAGQSPAVQTPEPANNQQPPDTTNQPAPISPPSFEPRSVDSAWGSWVVLSHPQHWLLPSISFISVNSLVPLRKVFSLSNVGGSSSVNFNLQGFLVMDVRNESDWRNDYYLFMAYSNNGSPFMLMVPKNRQGDGQTSISIMSSGIPPTGDSSVQFQIEQVSPNSATTLPVNAVVDNGANTLKLRAGNQILWQISLDEVRNMFRDSSFQWGIPPQFLPFFPPGPIPVPNGGSVQLPTTSLTAASSPTEMQLASAPPAGAVLMASRSVAPAGTTEAAADTTAGGDGESDIGIANNSTLPAPLVTSALTSLNPAPSSMPTIVEPLNSASLTSPSTDAAQEGAMPALSLQTSPAASPRPAVTAMAAQTPTAQSAENVWQLTSAAVLQPVLWPLQFSQLSGNSSNVEAPMTRPSGAVERVEGRAPTPSLTSFAALSYNRQRSPVIERMLLGQPAADSDSTLQGVVAAVFNLSEITEGDSSNTGRPQEHAISAVA